MGVLHEVDELDGQESTKGPGRKAAAKKGRNRAQSLRRHKGVQTSALLLKSISNEKRLSILYLLQDRERSVLDIAAAMRLRQPTVSQQLARLRADHLVKTRREGQTIFYSLACEKTGRLLDLLSDLNGK